MLALLFVCRTTLGLQLQTIGSTADRLVDTFAFSQTEIGVLVGLFMLPGLLLSLPAGRLGRRFTDRQLVVGGLVAMALGGAAAALAQGFGALALARILTGVGFVFGTVYFTKMVVDWFAGLELATAMSVLVMSWPVGVAMGQVGHAWLSATTGWPWAFGVASAASALAAIAMAWRYRAPPVGTTPVASAGGGLTAVEWKLTLIAALAWGLFNAGYVVYLSFAPRLLQSAGLGATDAAAVASLASWVMLGSAAVAGRVADRSGRPALVTVVCLAAGAAALLALDRPGWAVPAALGLGLFGAAPGGIIIALSARAMAAERRAFGMGVFYSAYFVIVTAGAPLAGWLFDRSGSARVAMDFAVLLFVATAAAYSAFEPLRRRWTAT